MSRVVEVICIRCPKGCKLRVEVGNKEISVTGHGCPLGESYGRDEALNPRRMVMSTVRIIGARYPRLPVRTSEPVPKDRIKDVIDALRGIVVSAPVKRGQVIVRNVASLGVDVISERDMERV